jgi:predicted ribosomally synthesized peptide with nif11-like leader
MSMEHTKEFIKKMQYDDSFRENIMAIDNLDMRFKAIADVGYDCTKDELLKLMMISTIANGSQANKLSICMSHNAGCQSPIIGFCC